MPIYEYECEQCHKTTEIWQHLGDEPLSACPDCQGNLKKLISQSSFQLKGGGWYADGYCSSGDCGTASTPSDSSKKVPAPSKSPAPSSCPKSKSGTESCCNCTS